MVKKDALLRRAKHKKIEYKKSQLDTFSGLNATLERLEIQIL